MVKEKITIVDAGDKPWSETLSSVETLSLSSEEDLATARWNQVGSLPAGRYSFPLVNLGDRLFILGGLNDVFLVEDTVLSSDDGGENWYLLLDRLEMATYGHTAVSTECIEGGTDLTQWLGLLPFDGRTFGHV